MYLTKKARISEKRKQQEKENAVEYDNQYEDDLKLKLLTPEDQVLKLWREKQSVESDIARLDKRNTTDSPSMNT